MQDSVPDTFKKSDVAAALSGFAATYDEGDDAGVWFDKIKAIAKQLGYADDMKEYRQNPEAFPGSVADVSMFLRLAVTGRMNSPDMYDVMRVLGRERVLTRVASMLKTMK